MSTASILILGVVMDTIYQWMVLDTFYPGQAAVIAILLAFVPYLILRGPFERIARHWVAPTRIKLKDPFEERTMASPDLKLDTNTDSRRAARACRFSARA